jgi:hypothetical protein
MIAHDARTIERGIIDMRVINIRIIDALDYLNMQCLISGRLCGRSYIRVSKSDTL